MLSKHLIPLTLFAAVTLSACDRTATGIDRTAESEATPNTMVIGPGGPNGPGRPGGDPPQPNSPHWTHARFATTAWAVQSLESELEHVARHYDLIMSGPLNQFHQRNPSGTYMPYTLLWHLPPYQGTPSLDSFFYPDMQQWYANPVKNTGGWNIEDAFLHRQHPRTAANRLLTPVLPDNYWWQERRWVMNPTDAGYRAYTIDRYQRMLADPSHNAIFIDEHSWEISLMDGSVEHTQASLRNGIADFYAAIRPGLNNAVLMFNTANYHPSQLGPWILDAVGNAGGVHLESVVHAFMEFPQVMGTIEAFAQTGAVVKPTSNITRETYNNAQWTFGVEFPRGNHATPGDRGKMVELAMYYMALTSPERMYFSPAPHGSYVESWYPPYQRNVGAPVAARMLYASGLDGAGQWGEVYARPFSNALVLLRPLAGWVPNPNYSNSSVMTVMLPPGTWHRVLDNNMLDARSSQSVQLRLAEAAIFVRVN